MRSAAIARIENVGDFVERSLRSCHQGDLRINRQCLRFSSVQHVLEMEQHRDLRKLPQNGKGNSGLLVPPGTPPETLQSRDFRAQ
jgi:hypothetical protein